ncbi:hypothetical protein BH09PSE4_BH09PSE4_02280 [soil metagenome]
MDGRKIVLLVGALLIAGVTAFMARSLIAGSGAPMAGASTNGTVVIDGPEVLVATRALPVGTILDATALKFQPWPKELVEGAYYLKEGTNLQSLQGTVVRNAITAGQPVTQGSLVKPGDRGFLAAALGPGMRAVSVPVSAQGSVAGFIFPGDRVDLVLTSTVPGGGDGPPLKVSETVLRNLRVLATDQRTDNQAGEDGKTIVKTFSSVTVEATPKIAEKIAVAQTLGGLSMSLRSIADNGQELEEAIASGDIKVPTDPKAEKAMLAKIASAPIDTGTTFQTGADVSRFQRRSVPGKTDSNNSMAMNGGPPAPGTPFGSTPIVNPGPVVHVARGNSVTDVSVGEPKK